MVWVITLGVRWARFSVTLFVIRTFRNVIYSIRWRSVKDEETRRRGDASPRLILQTGFFKMRKVRGQLQGLLDFHWIERTFIRGDEKLIIRNEKSRSTATLMMWARAETLSVVSQGNFFNRIWNILWLRADCNPFTSPSSSLCEGASKKKLNALSKARV